MDKSGTLNNSDAYGAILSESIENCLQTLVDMGFSRDKALEAFSKTGNQSVELATSYLLGLDISEEQAASSGDEWEDLVEDHKMVFVVNSDLQMSIGKTAAQVAHGCLGMYKQIENGGSQDSKENLNLWLEEGQKKIVLSGKNADALHELKRRAEAAGVPAHLVRDAGHTEVMPGSVTVLAVFGTEENVNKITGQKKIVLSGKNADALHELKRRAEAAGVPAHLVRDAGHTEVMPGSVTVLAVFGTEENVNKITGSLKLLK